MLASAVLGTVAIIVAIPLVVLLWDLPSELPDNYATLQSIATTIALALGGIWAYFQFVLYRNQQPHLTVSQQVTFRSVNADYFQVNAVGLLNNTSRVKVEIQKVSFQLQQVAPISSLDTERLRDEVFVSKEREDIQWPVLYERTREWNARLCVVEPGETLEITCEFIVPSAMKSIIIYTYVHNSQYKGNLKRVQGWPKSTICDLTVNS